MSGIFGIWRKDQLPLETNHITAIRNAMRPWGTAEPTCWQTETMLLGHCQMDNTPEAHHDQQPAALGTLRISADARLDNRVELCDALNIPHAQRTALPDSVLIGHAYQKWGQRCTEKLLGAFAFVIWDAHSQTLFMGRDHLGIRPIVYYDTPNIIIFASDVRAVLAVDRVPELIDDELLVRYSLLDAQLLQSRTFFHHIYKVPPAHSLTATLSKTTNTRYWHPENTRRLRLKSNAAHVEMMQHHLTEAVTCRLRTNQPIGAHLSGGLDSSAIAVIAARALRQLGGDIGGLYSWSPAPIDHIEEQRLIAAVCEQEDLFCHYTPLTPADIAHVARRDKTRELTAGYAEESVVRAAAQNQGVRILLSGWGGDEFASFNGRGCFSEMFVTGRWWQLAQALRQEKRRKQATYYQLAYWQLARPLMPDALYRARGHDISSLQAHRQQPITPLEEQIWRAQSMRLRNRPNAQKMQLALLACGHLPYRIEAWAVEGLPYQLEYRYPLLDKRLIEFCLALPPGQYAQSGWRRFLFRQAMSGILPESVRWHESKAEPSGSRRYETVLQQFRQSKRSPPHLGISSA